MAVLFLESGEVLSDLEKEEVLRGLDGYFQQLHVQDGYQSGNLIVLHKFIRKTIRMQRQA